MSAPNAGRRAPSADPRHSTEGGLLAEVRSGLLAPTKALPAKLFYDAEGARLFERICELPEYYLTRAELSVLGDRAPEIAALAGPGCALVEYGSGAGIKVRLLLDALADPTAYVPIDVSREQLLRVAAEVTADYPGVAVLPVCADYTGPLQLPTLPAGTRRLAFFPGSTIGNFHRADAAAFLRRLRGDLGKGGALVLGVDGRHSAAVHLAAYDDQADVTAAFNLNLLRRLNREFDGRFDLSGFRHEARFDPALGRVEMHLVSLADQIVPVAGIRVRFARGESIWTESSYKYARADVERLAAAAGFVVARLWTDPHERFWVTVLTDGAHAL